MQACIRLQPSQNGASQSSGASILQWEIFIVNSQNKLFSQWGMLIFANG